MSARPLALLHLVNAVLTIAAFVLGNFFPPTLFKWVGVDIHHDAYLAPYMLGSAELPIGLMSLAILRITDARAVRAWSLACAVFHFASVGSELHAEALGIESGSSAWINIALRTTLGILFLVLGVVRVPRDQSVRW
ncbi:hypothetical protein ACIHDR_42660 [Nocardia sp. NPDC052278]|uniref:hypothetical protein n=1 Tax=unclassified Nocardia TaxID=2637762 RepID=UPI0036921BBE